MASDSQSQESQETTSRSLLEDSLNISFEDLTYTVRNGFLTGGRKAVLAGINGAFNAGELTVIMGQSGAGKSTLLDILAGYNKPTNGTVYVNGHPRTLKTFRRRSCYILQDDMVQDMLTIPESLAIAAELKLGNHISNEQKRRRVQEIISSLGLSKAAQDRTCAGNLSGGQKKRLAIGLELVSDPSVMFLDEPTSGLDSSISKQIMYLLHLLARQGRTVVITIHQPSVALLDMVDRLYAVVGGRCAYMGPVTMLRSFLKEVDFCCPPYHDIADFLIELCGEHPDVLVENSQNGRNIQWINNIPQETDSELEDKGNLSLVYKCDVTLTSLPPPNEDLTNKILLKIKSTYTTSFWKQFTTLTRRSLLSIWRNPSFTVMITGIHCAMALFVGCLFYDIGQDASHVRDNYNYLYFSLMFLMFTAFSAVSITFPEQIPLIRREHFNRWYMTGAYFAASLVSVLPTQTVCTLCYACITYWLTGQPPDITRFAVFCFTLTLVSYVSLCIGFLNGSLFNVKNGVVFGPLFIMPLTVFSGFFLRYQDAPFLLRWLFQVSFLKHGLTGVVISIFGMNRPKLPCPESTYYCHYTFPKQFLHDNGMDHDLYWVAVMALFAIFFVAMICSYIILKIRLKSKW